LEALEWYQSVQDKQIYGNAKLLVSFIKTEKLGSEFVGVYRVQGVSKQPKFPPFADELPNELLAKLNHPLHYRLTRDPDFDQFRGRIRIAWDRVESRWVRQGEDANREITGLNLFDGGWVAPKDRASLFALRFMPEEDDPVFIKSIYYPEGSRTLKTHLSIERNQALVHDSKEAFKRRHGRLFCQVCGFDFYRVYGEEFIECHHTIPVHKLSSDGQTGINDVALVCSNCHRMIHRRKEWLRLDQLIQIIARNEVRQD
jgi:hypothetical protein